MIEYVGIFVNLFLQMLCNSLKKKKKGSFVTKMINSAIEYKRKLKLPSYHEVTIIYLKKKSKKCE